MQFMTTEERNHLDWLAFRYIADEFSDAERAEFEQQLADSQPAREAVASAVELTEAIAVAGAVEELTVAAAPSVERPHRSRWMRRVAWLSMGAAACLALVFVCQGFVIGPMVGQQSDESADGGVAVRKTASPDLAIAWSQTRAELEVGSEGSWTWALAADSAGPDDPYIADDLPLSDVLVDEGSTVAAPDWMLAAVSGMMSKSSTDVKE